MENKSFYKKTLFKKMSDRKKDRRTQLNYVLRLADQCKYIRLTKIIIIYPNSKVKIKEK